MSNKFKFFLFLTATFIVALTTFNIAFKFGENIGQVDGRLTEIVVCMQDLDRLANNMRMECLDDIN